MEEIVEIVEIVDTHRKSPMDGNRENRGEGNRGHPWESWTPIERPNESLSG